MGYIDDRLCKKMSIKELEEYIANNYVLKQEWTLICEVQKLSWKFVNKYEEKIDWYALSVNPYLNDAIIECYSDKLNWGSIAQYHKLDENFVRRWWTLLVYHSFQLAQNKTFTVGMCRIVRYNIDWYEASKAFGEEFIRAFPDYIEWECILKQNHLYGEEFYREFIDYFDIYDLTYHILGFSGYENLLREVKDRIDWDEFIDRYGGVTTAYSEVYDWWLNNKEKNNENED